MRTCDRCGDPFRPTEAWQRYCSNVCAMEANFEREAAGDGSSAPMLVLQLELECAPRVFAVADTQEDERRLAAHVDRLLRRNPGVLHATVAGWMVWLEEAA